MISQSCANYKRISLKKIRTRHDHLAEDDDVVSAIAESYKSDKQIHPIVVRRIKIKEKGKNRTRYELITGSFTSAISPAALGSRMLM
jgi:ParB/Sulfiredoxin domain